MRKRIDKRWDDLAELKGFSHGYVKKSVSKLKKRIRRRIKKSENEYFDKISEQGE